MLSSHAAILRSRLKSGRRRMGEKSRLRFEIAATL